MIGVFALAYVFASALLVIGTFGPFGAVRDPVSGIYQILLGVPWNSLLVADATEVLLTWIGILAPLLNLVILLIICLFFRTRISQSTTREGITKWEKRL
jgi:hypothetical protein